jgi:hypothetical protein
MMARNILDREVKEIVEVPHDFDTNYCTLTRYLPKENELNSRPLYFDKPHLGWFVAPKVAKIFPSSIPYQNSMCDTKDLFYE